MAQPQYGWSQDPFTSRKRTSSGPRYSEVHIQLPSTSSLFTAAASICSPSRPPPSPSRSAISLPTPAPSRGDYTTPSAMGQTPPQLPVPIADPHPQPQRVRPDDYDLPLSFRHPQHYSLQPYMARHRGQEPASNRHVPSALISSQVPAGSTSLQVESNQMSITSLLSEESAPQPSVQPLPPHALTNTKPLTPSPAQSPPSPEYCIRVRQQPLAARSCGFGERDRRVIDPPPIVQLSIEDPKATPEEISKRLRFQFTVLYCSIWNETGDQDFSAMPEDYRQQRRLMGTLVSSPFVGQDENGDEGCFFCFPDLSCRTPGSFRLKFALVVLDPLSMRRGSSSPIMATVMSDAFTVYNAKDFPGMQASTALTKRLKEQGCLISIKKGNDKTTAVHAREDSDDDGDGPGKGRKRTKR